MLETLAIIPDGNRRFSKKKGISLKDAYTKGFEKADELLHWCLDLPDIKNIIIYGLSAENLNRNKLQLSLLLKLYSRFISKALNDDELMRRGVKIKFIGDLGKLKSLKNLINELEEKTKNNSSYNLYVALAYSSKDEIFSAVKKSDTINDVFKNLEMPHKIDLIIRTSPKRQRLSNFLLWQSAYSELYFIDKLWPELTKADFDEAVEFYNSTKRNLGK